MSNKFVIGDHVRVTNPLRDEFDRTGVVTGYAEIQCEPASKVMLTGTDLELIFRHTSLTLADPDVHTVLDQMDAESGRVRSKVLRTAESLVNGDRARDYGDPAENFGRIADLWAPILGLSASPEQVALCMAQVKVARLITSPTHSDSWIDLCGYAALGAEIADGS